MVWNHVILRGLTVALGLWPCEGLLAQDALILQETHIAEPLGQFLQAVLLPDDAKPLAELDKNQLVFKPNQGGYLDAGFVDGRVLLRVDIQNNSPDTRRIFLEHREVFVPFIRLTADDTGHSQLATLTTFQGEFKQNYHFHVFQLDVKPGKNRYWIEIKGIPKRLKLYLWDHQSFMSRGLHEHTLLMMFMAFPLVLIIYELLLFLTGFDRLRLIYILAISSVWVSSFISTGTIRMVVPSSALEWIFTTGIYSSYLLASTMVPHQYQVRTPTANSLCHLARHQRPGARHHPICPVS